MYLSWRFFQKRIFPVFILASGAVRTTPSLCRHICMRSLIWRWWAFAKKRQIKNHAKLTSYTVFEWELWIVFWITFLIQKFPHLCFHLRYFTKIVTLLLHVPSNNGLMYVSIIYWLWYGAQKTWIIMCVRIRVPLSSWKASIVKTRYCVLDLLGAMFRLFIPDHCHLPYMSTPVRCIENQGAG